MSTGTTRERVISSFRSFVSRSSPDDLYQYNATFDPTTLAEYIQAWLEWGNGVQACFGNVRVYLTGVLLIVDEWIIDPGLLDYHGSMHGDPRGDVERRVTQVLGSTQLDDILDPDYFMSIAFDALRPSRES
jgi:hypothetical protein